MNNKMINKDIRKISNSSSLPLLLYIILSNIIIYGFSYICHTFKDNELLQDTGFTKLVLYVVIYLIVIPFILYIYQKCRGRKIGISLGSVFRKPQKSTGWCVVWIIIALGFTYIASMFSNMLFTFIEDIFNIELNSASLSFGNSIFGIVMTLVAPPLFAPVFEELLFRGVIYRNNEPMGQWFAIIVSGITFGLWHENYPQLIYAAVLGMFSCFIIAKTRSIIPSMILHFIVNTISTVMMIIYMNAGINNIENITNNMKEIFFKYPYVLIASYLLVLYEIGVIVAGITLFIFQLAKHHRSLKLMKSVFPVSNLRKFAVYFSAPITIISFLLMIFATVYYALA